MPAESASLAEALRHACKGGAMRVTDPVAKLGPLAAAAFGLDPGEPAATIRHKVRERIRRLLDDEPPERHRTVALGMLALLAKADHRRLGDRVNYLAAELRVGSTTVRRRAVRAMDLLADALSGAPREPVRVSDDGFVLRRFAALLRLDTQRPELHETRTIEVSADRIDEIPGRFTLPGSGADGELEIRAEAGVTGAHIRSRKSGHFTFTLDLPRSLRYGDVFEYRLVFTIPAGQPMRPHFVFQPLLPCDGCRLAVQFDPSAPPQRVWLFDGEPIRVLDEEEPEVDEVRPDVDGLWQRDFTEPRQGLAYGVKWRPAG